MDTATVFRVMRAVLHLNQVQMAKLLGIEQGTLSKIEANQVDPGTETFRSLYNLAMSKPKLRAILHCLLEPEMNPLAPHTQPRESEAAKEG